MFRCNPFVGIIKNLTWYHFVPKFQFEVTRSPCSILRVEPGTCKPLAVCLWVEAKCSAMNPWKRVWWLWANNMWNWRIQRIERRLNKNWRTPLLKVLVENHCHYVIPLVDKWLKNFIQLLRCTITIQHHYSWCKSLSTNGITSHMGILYTVDGTILRHSRVYENVLLLLG